jgi:hypothetical protein
MFCVSTGVQQLALHIARGQFCIQNRIVLHGQRTRLSCFPFQLLLRCTLERSFVVIDLLLLFGTDVDMLSHAKADFLTLVK